MTGEVSQPALTVGPDGSDRVDRDSIVRAGEGTAMQVVYRELIDRRLPLVERGCTSKSAYASRREANSIVRHGRHMDGTLRPYRCGLCESWHLGHRRTRPR